MTFNVNNKLTGFIIDPFGSAAFFDKTTLPNITRYCQILPDIEQDSLLAIGLYPCYNLPIIMTERDLPAKRPNIVSLISIEKITANLSGRDLEACIAPAFDPEPQPPYVLGMKLYEPRYWRWLGGIRYWLDRWANGRKESPTYRAVSDRKDMFPILLTLAERQAIRDGSVQDLADGLMKVPALDQLAISRLPETTVIRLDRDGFGLWPVKEGQNFSDIDWEKLRLSLTGEQLGLLHQTQNSGTRAVGGLWFQDERLTAANSPLTQPYLPTAVEVLQAFQAFYDQEGFFPHSQHRWFITGSVLQHSFASAFESFVSKMPLKQILRGIIINQSYISNEIRRLMVMGEGDFELTRVGGGKARRREGRLEIIDSEGHLRFCLGRREDSLLDFFLPRSSDSEGQDDLWVRARNGSQIEVKDGIYTVKNPENKVLAQLGLEVLEKEVEATLNRARSIAGKTISFPVVLRSDRKQGVKIGISTVGDNIRSTYRLANNTLHFNVLTILRPYIDFNLHDIEVLEGVYWPRIFPDQYAGYLYL